MRNLKFYTNPTTARFLLFSVFAALLLSACRTTSQRSGLSEVDVDALYSSSIETAHLSVYAKKETSINNGVHHTFYALPFVVELSQNGAPYFVNLSKAPADTVSNHNYLLQQLDAYRGQSYFELITPGPGKKLSSGYLYFKESQGEISDPIGFELVLLNNGQNITEPTYILDQSEEIAKVYSVLKNAINIDKSIHYTGAGLNTNQSQQVQQSFESKVGFPFTSFEKIVGTRNPVYTAGKSYGYLKTLGYEQMRTGFYTHKDILVVDKLPLEISPVSGIISSFPQTPLSHVVIKTKQLGVPNIYVEDPKNQAIITKYLDTPDNLVELTVLENGSIEIKGKDELPSFLLTRRADNFWKSFRPADMPDLTPDLSNTTLFNWRGQNIPTNLTHTYGAKGVNFAALDDMLKKDGYSQRSLYDQSFLVPFSFYQQHINTPISANLCQEAFERCQRDDDSLGNCSLANQSCPSSSTINDYINKFLAPSNIANRDDLNKRFQFLGFIRALIREANLSNSTEQAIASKMQGYPTTTRMRMRSSTNAEDLPGLNGAGLYVSKSACLGDENNNSDVSKCRTSLEITRINNLITELRATPNTDPEVIEDLEDKLENTYRLSRQLPKVYASLWNNVAFADRETYGIDHSKVKMGVLVHPSFVDESANGVVLIEDKSGGFIISVTVQIEDLSITNPEITSARPEVLSIHTNTSGTIERSETILSSNRTNEAVLSEAQVKDLATQVVKVHKLQKERLSITFTGKTDIEFVFDKDKKLLIKQARPL